MADRSPSVRSLMQRFTQKISWLLFLSVAGFVTVHAADAQKITFYIQLVRGSDSDKPDDPAWKQPAVASVAHGVSCAGRRCHKC